jgi:hypothetical protein
MIGRDDVAGARHVLDHDRRLAGNMPCDMASNEPRPEIVVLSRRGADNELELLAAEETVSALRGSDAVERKKRAQDEHAGSFHP